MGVRAIIVDHSGIPKSLLPPVSKRDLILFHWSPTKNRQSIRQSGLTPNAPSVGGDWNPPCICFGDDPWLAWILSGQLIDIESWDLWVFNATNQNSIDQLEIITDVWPDSGRRYIKEYRVYDRILPTDVQYLATRAQ